VWEAGGMSLLDRVREAAGGARWTKLRRFKSHLMLDGSAVASLERDHSLKEIVAEGDVATGSVRISGFSEASAAWSFHPDFVTIQHRGGGFVGARRQAAPRAFRHPKDEAELVYFCGLSIWSCMTVPLSWLAEGVRTEELGAWSEQGQTWDRLKVTAPEGALACAREAVMYFDVDGMLRRTDFEWICDGVVPVVAYSSAYQSFAGFTLPTLHRALRRAPSGGVLQRTPLLDVEIFDAAFA
jgi:hypothetical protein